MTSVRPENRPQLTIVPEGTRHGSRSYATCFFKCGNACDQAIPNQTDHHHIHDEITRAVGRRGLLRAGGGLAAGALMVGAVVRPDTAVAHGKGGGHGHGHGHGHGGHGHGRPSTLADADFTPIQPNKFDEFVVPDGFDHDVVIRWGDPVVKGAPAFDASKQSVAAAQKQFGYNCDYVGVLPLDRHESLLVVNHEYTNENMMFPTDVYDAEEQKRIAIANHGMSVVTIRRSDPDGNWKTSDVRWSRHNRRIHSETRFELTGPAAGHELLRTSADRTGRKVKGTFNNCAGGTTPWGTVLSGEENFNQYFDKGASEFDPDLAAAYARYGIVGVGTRGWGTVDSRFDLSVEPNEPHRFGWVVEIDPYDPLSTPKKHTMLGRFKHEGANVAIAKDGRAVAYSGDDERGDYMYKFVSEDRYRPGNSRWARAHNMTLLTKGTLYVAKLVGDGTADGTYDGSGEWIPLCTDELSFVPGMSVAEVLIFTRLAADKLTPTKMDRPEDIEPNPVNGKVYVALTNNSNRGSASMPADEANPLTTSMVRASIAAPLTPASGNRNGYVLEISPHRGDHASTKFTWDLFLVCGDPEAPEVYFGGFDKTKVSPISCPDNVAFDSEGNLWISTDGNVLGSNDGVFRVPVEGRNRGQVQQFCTVPKGAEACGPLITDGDRSLWVAVQHPGETGAPFEEPSSTWPHSDAFPRPSVVVSYPKARRGR